MTSLYSTNEPQTQLIFSHVDCFGSVTTSLCDTKMNRTWSASVCLEITRDSQRVPMSWLEVFCERFYSFSKVGMSCFFCILEKLLCRYDTYRQHQHTHKLSHKEWCAVIKAGCKYQIHKLSNLPNMCSSTLMQNVCSEQASVSCPLLFLKYL